MPWFRPQWTSDWSSPPSSNDLMGSTIFLGTQQNFESEHKGSYLLLSVRGHLASQIPSPIQHNCLPVFALVVDETDSSVLTLVVDTTDSPVFRLVVDTTDSSVESVTGSTDSRVVVSVSWATFQRFKIPIKFISE
jgi:hypothetical protein